MRTTYVKNRNDNYERRPVNSKRAIREPDTKSDVHVPLQWGFSAGLFVLLVFAGICLYLGQWPTIQGIGLALIIASIVSFGAFIWKSNWTNSAIWSIETVTGIDLDRDGFTGEPAHPFNVNRNVGRKASLDYQQKFAEFVNELYMNGTNHHGLRGKFNDQMIGRFRQYCVDMGIAKWKSEKSHNPGIELIVDQTVAEEIIAKTPWVDVDKNAQRKR